MLTGIVTYFILWWIVSVEARVQMGEGPHNPTRWVCHQSHRWQLQRCVPDRVWTDPEHMKYGFVLFPTTLVHLFERGGERLGGKGEPIC